MDTILALINRALTKCWAVPFHYHSHRINALRVRCSVCVTGIKSAALETLSLSLRRIHRSTRFYDFFLQYTPLSTHCALHRPKHRTIQVWQTMAEDKEVAEAMGK